MLSLKDFGRGESENVLTTRAMSSQNEKHQRQNIPMCGGVTSALRQRWWCGLGTQESATFWWPWREGCQQWLWAASGGSRTAEGRGKELQDSLGCCLDGTYTKSHSRRALRLQGASSSWVRLVRSSDVKKPWRTWHDLVFTGALMFPIDWEKWKDFKLGRDGVSFPLERSLLINRGVWKLGVVKIP